ncbi:pentapeptide repeat-containing protein [Streptomyces sp. NPDC002306]
MPPTYRLVLAARPLRPWLRIRASQWWRRVLIAAGAQQAAWSQNQHGADLRGANLHGANLAGANLHGANLAGANLYDANLAGANLRSADLAGADLTIADLRDAHLVSANLHGAHIIDAELSGADLSDTNLSGAELSGANLMRVTWSERTRWSGALALQMRARSVPIGGGKWRVEGSGNSGAALEVPPVPVH